MNELSIVLQEVLNALGIECAEAVGLHRGADPGDHHPRPAAAKAAGT